MKGHAFGYIYNVQKLPVTVFTLQLVSELSGSTDTRELTLCIRKAKQIPSFAWDYRWMDYPGMGRDVRHPYDQSLMTYKGHLVLRTLIRCYFSPMARSGDNMTFC